MKAPKIYLKLLLCLLLIPHPLMSQDSLHYRKLYLHSDREHYFLGDTLWYKGYYLDGQSNTFIPGIITLYAGLVDAQGHSVAEQVVALDNGAASGAIAIPDTLEAGNYMLRAFTDFQKEIGEEAFFHKPLKISRLESFVEQAEEAPQSLPDEIYLDFLPEGGMLLEGMENKVAFKATDGNGKGVPLEGEILNSRGNSVTLFSTGSGGMGAFDFTPLEGETYTARTAAFPAFHYRFADILQEGIKIEFDREEGSDLHFRVVSNSSAYESRTYFFAIEYHGDVIFYRKFVPGKDIFPITVQKDALPAGINRMVLMDEQLRPVSERLFFSANYDINKIEIRTDRPAYETRSRVRLRLQDGEEMEQESWSNLSMAVVDEFAIGKEGPSVDIRSWLLINSELKGLIENPSEYFVDAPGLSSAQKLDLLMLTQGWRRYVWKEPEKYLAREAEDREGFALSGEVQKVLGRNPANEGSVELKIYNSNFMHTDEVELGSDGRFLFGDVNFMDTASVFIQARNNREKLAYQVHLHPVFDPFPPTNIYRPPGESPEYRRAELYQKQYDNLQALKEYTLKSGGFFIEEVSITEHRREADDGHFRIYSKPSNSLQVTERDITYLNVIDYMQGRFAGVHVSKDGGISIRGPSGLAPRPPLFILDGIPVDKEIILYLPMNDVDRVEVLKNPSETAIFGTRGGAGVVAVFTKKGAVRDYSDTYIPGTIAEKLAGYASQREFYSPVYTRDNIRSERPDNRMVLHWDPNIFTENGKATVSFFSSDDISRYRVYVEGITSDGRICLGTTSFDVDKRNDQLTGR